VLQRLQSKSKERKYDFNTALGLVNEAGVSNQLQVVIKCCFDKFF